MPTLEVSSNQGNTQSRDSINKLECGYVGCSEREDGKGYTVLQPSEHGARVDWYCCIMHAALALLDDARDIYDSLGSGKGFVLDVTTRSLKGERILLDGPPAIN